MSTGFIPRLPGDFNDGGAYPEIHVAQYPLDMGRPGRVSQPLFLFSKDLIFVKSQSQSVVPVTVDKDGEVRYDAIIKQGANRDKTVFSSYTDMIEKRVDEVLLLHVIAMQTTYCLRLGATCSPW